MAKHRIYTMTFSSVYPHYVTKVESKWRTVAELDEVILRLTWFTQKQLDALKKDETNFEDFFKQAPELNKHRKLIKGVVCGVRIEEIQDTLMREIRYMDKMVDELAKGKKMEKILRTP